MIVPKKDPLRVYFNESLGGWCVDVDKVLPKSAIIAMSRYVYKIQEDRWRGLPHGEQKEKLGRALKDLQEFKIRQVPKGPQLQLY